MENEFKCSICFNIPLSPTPKSMQSNQNDSTLFCKNCIQDWLKSKESRICPKCIQQLHQQQLTKHFRLQIDKVDTNCTQCHGQVKYNKISSHLQLHQDLDITQLLQMASDKVNFVYFKNPQFDFSPLPVNFQKKNRVNVKFLRTKENCFVGEIINGKFDGRGALYCLQSGSLTLGFWSKGQLNGKCQIILNNGVHFLGNFTNHTRFGEGKFTYQNGVIKQGTYLNGQLEGPGKITFSDKTVLSGNFKNDKLNGIGRQITPTGTIYEGQFQDDKLVKIDSIVYPNKDFYSGEISNFKKHGVGVMTYANGSNYSGQWVDDKKHGFGTFKQSRMRKESSFQVWSEGRLMTTFKQGEGNVKGLNDVFRNLSI